MVVGELNYFSSEAASPSRVRKHFRDRRPQTAPAGNAMISAYQIHQE